MQEVRRTASLDQEYGVAGLSEAPRHRGSARAGTDDDEVERAAVRRRWVNDTGYGILSSQGIQTKLMLLAKELLDWLYLLCT